VRSDGFVYVCGVVRWGRASWSWCWTWTSYRTHRYVSPLTHHSLSYTPTDTTRSPSSPIHQLIPIHHSKPSLPPLSLPPLTNPPLSLHRTWVVWVTRSTTGMGTTSSGLLWWVGPAPPPSPPISRGSTAPPPGSPSPHPSRYDTTHHAQRRARTRRTWKAEGYIGA
jgi:hypothetical protein